MFSQSGLHTCWVCRSTWPRRFLICWRAGTGSQCTLVCMQGDSGQPQPAGSRNMLLHNRARIMHPDWGALTAPAVPGVFCQQDAVWLRGVLHLRQQAGHQTLLQDVPCVLQQHAHARPVVRCGELPATAWCFCQCGTRRTLASSATRVVWREDARCESEQASIWVPNFIHACLCMHMLGGVRVRHRCWPSLPAAQ